MRRWEENDKHETSCRYAHFLKQNNNRKKLPKLTRKEEECSAPRESILRWKTSEYTRSFVRIARAHITYPVICVARARYCHTHSMRAHTHTKNKHNRKWLIIVCLFFSLFALSLFFHSSILFLRLALFWALHQKVLLLENHFSINFVGATCASMHFFSLKIGSFLFSFYFIPVILRLFDNVVCVRALRSIWTI